MLFSYYIKSALIKLKTNTTIRFYVNIFVLHFNCSRVDLKELILIKKNIIFFFLLFFQR